MLRNPKIFSLHCYNTKKSSKFSHWWSCNQRMIGIFSFSWLKGLINYQNSWLSVKNICLCIQTKSQSKNMLLNFLPLLCQTTPSSLPQAEEIIHIKMLWHKKIRVNNCCRVYFITSTRWHSAGFKGRAVCTSLSLWYNVIWFNSHIAPTWMFVPGCNMTQNGNMILVLTWLFNFDILWVD